MLIAQPDGCRYLLSAGTHDLLAKPLPPKKGHFSDLYRIRWTKNYSPCYLALRVFIEVQRLKSDTVFLSSPWSSLPNFVNQNTIVPNRCNFV